MPPELIKFFQEIVQDGDGIYSSKRIITIVAFILLGVAFISNLYWGFAVAQYILDPMLYIVISGFGFATVGEKVTDLWKAKAAQPDPKTE